MVKAGGCYAYVLNQKAAKKCKYLVCIRNGHSRKQKEHDVPHSHAFLIAPIDSIEPYSGNRKIIKFSRHVLANHFVQWGRQIGRVDKSYGTLRDFGFSKPKLVAAVRGERWDADFDAKVKESLQGGAEARKKRLAQAPKKPKVVLTTVSRFERNPDVVAEVLEAANGVCGVCNKPAPFQKRLDGTPYLEVHHIIPLAQGGEDTVKNALAACPNCHREAHYG